MKNKRNRFDEEGHQDVEIILTPLIDTLLVLLIIFIVATPAASYFVSINLPNGTFNTQKSSDESLCFAIDQYGAIFNQNKKKITHKEMEESVSWALKKNTTLSVVLFADSMSLSGKLIEIIDSLRALGVIHVYCKTKKITL